MPYDFTLDALFRPQMRPVFVHADRMPRFRPEARDLDLVNAWWLSNAAHLAYYEEEGVRRELARVGWELLEFYLQGGTEGYLARADGFAVLAFRGTQAHDWDDVKADLTFPLAPFREGARVHLGFRDALAQVWDRVEPRIAELDGAGVPVWYTGHSLGAALATLAAARRRPAAVFTFGSPRVGDAGLDTLLAGVGIQRFVHCCDIVPSMPPDWLGFRHLGVHRYLTARGKLRTDPVALLLLADRIFAITRYFLTFPYFRRNRVGLRSLADHGILNYTASLERAIERQGDLEDDDEEFRLRE